VQQLCLRKGAVRPGAGRPRFRGGRGRCARLVRRRVLPLHERGRTAVALHLKQDDESIRSFWQVERPLSLLSRRRLSFRLIGEKATVARRTSHLIRAIITSALVSGNQMFVPNIKQFVNGHKRSNGFRGIRLFDDGSRATSALWRQDEMHFDSCFSRQGALLRSDPVA
jgi:hypothetical protein